MQESVYDTAPILSQPPTRISGILYYSEIETSVGKIHLAISQNKICFLSFVDIDRFEQWKERYATHALVEQLNIEKPQIAHPIFQEIEEYFSGERQKFSSELLFTGTRFQQSVYRELLKIPYGDTVSYGEIAKALGDPDLGRAVGNANGKNPIALLCPCHRVIGSKGKLRGFAGGTDIKKGLLRIEYEQTTTQLDLLSF